jgi:hypothetical protein
MLPFLMVLGAVECDDDMLKAMPGGVNDFASGDLRESGCF